MSDTIPKCLYCEKITWSRQKVIYCSICKSVTHAKCLSNTSRVSASFLRSRSIFHCKTCIANSLPFQSVSNNDILSIFGNTIHDLVNIFNSLDDQILPYEIEIENNIDDCKYIYKHELKSTSFGNSNEELCMIHVNIRSIYKNFDKLLILLERFQKMPDIICLSETNILKTETENPFIPSLEGYFLSEMMALQTWAGLEFS